MYSLLLAVDQVLARHSPVIIIQRWVKGWLVRKTLSRNPNPKIRCVWAGGMLLSPNAMYFTMYSAFQINCQKAVWQQHCLQAADKDDCT